MNVKELLFENVKGRVRGLLWNNVIADLEAEEKTGVFTGDKDVIKYLYERTLYWYKEYEPLLKKMGQGIAEETKKGTKEGQSK